MALQEKDIKALILLGVIAVGALFYYLFLMDGGFKDSYDKMVAEREKRQEKIKTALRKALNLNRIKYDVDKMKAELKELEKKFPDESTYLDLLPKMEALGKKFGYIFQLKYLNEISYEDGLYREVPLALIPQPLKPRGKSDIEKKSLSLQQVCKLLYIFSKYDNLLDIKDFTMNPANKEKDLFIVELKVSFYMFNNEKFKINKPGKK